VRLRIEIGCDQPWHDGDAEIGLHHRQHGTGLGELESNLRLDALARQGIGDLLPAARRIVQHDHAPARKARPSDRLWFRELVVATTDQHKRILQETFDVKFASLDFAAQDAKLDVAAPDLRGDVSCRDILVAKIYVLSMN